MHLSLHTSCLSCSIALQGRLPGLATLPRCPLITPHETFLMKWAALSLAHYASHAQAVPAQLALRSADGRHFICYFKVCKQNYANRTSISLHWLLTSCCVPRLLPHMPNFRFYTVNTNERNHDTFDFREVPEKIPLVGRSVCAGWLFHLSPNNQVVAANISAAVVYEYVLLIRYGRYMAMGHSD
jgi:hypothetical protein